MSYNSSFAVDKNEVDQSFSGLLPTVVTADHVLWDFNSDYQTSTSDFVVPVDGIYDFDIQVRIKGLTNVTAVEMAMFRRGTGPGGTDEYWFALGKSYINVVDTEVHLAAQTEFNFVENEHYCVKLILSGVLPAATIAGDSVYTSWGFHYVSDLTGH